MLELSWTIGNSLLEWVVVIRRFLFLNVNSNFKVKEVTVTVRSWIPWKNSFLNLQIFFTLYFTIYFQKIVVLRRIGSHLKLYMEMWPFRLLIRLVLKLYEGNSFEKHHSLYQHEIVKCFLCTRICHWDFSTYLKSVCDLDLSVCRLPVL